MFDHSYRNIIPLFYEICLKLKPYVHCKVCLSFFIEIIKRSQRLNGSALLLTISVTVIVTLYRISSLAMNIANTLWKVEFM